MFSTGSTSGNASLGIHDCDAQVTRWSRPCTRGMNPEDRQLGLIERYWSMVAISIDAVHLEFVITASPLAVE